MVDVTWKVFSQTGNIETYLLLKELENEPNTPGFLQKSNEDTASIDTKV